MCLFACVTKFFGRTRQVYNEQLRPHTGRLDTGGFKNRLFVEVSSGANKYLMKYEEKVPLSCERSFVFV